jgi:hypothetical protein
VAVTKTVTAEVALWGGPGDPQIDQNRPLRASVPVSAGATSAAARP